MNSFGFYLPTNIQFGNDVIELLSSYVSKDDIVLVVTDKNLIDIGLLDKAFTILKNVGCQYNIFSDVEPNPTVKVVDKASDYAKEVKANKIVAFGGGSSIDTAKGIAVVATNNGSSYDYLDGRGESKRNIINKPLPIIAIPTTSGTGSEVSMYSVITDKDMIKDSISSSLIYPQVALIDPKLTMDLPPYITACTGLDVLGHALEAYTSTIENDFTNLFALKALDIVFNHLPAAVNNPTLESREQMAFASVLAGSAMSHCGATLPHALGCPLSSYANLPHGLSVGLLQIAGLEHNREMIENKIAQVLQYMHITYDNENPVDVLIQMIKDLLDSINISQKLRNDLLNPELLSNLVHDASIHGCVAINQVELSKEKIRVVYEDLFTGH